LEKDKIITELQYKAVRSSGAGGQNVNKVSSKVVLTFNLKNSLFLTPEEKETIANKIASKLTLEGVLILHCDEDRSQLKNKEIVTKRLVDILTKALIKPKVRKATKIPRSVIENRIKAKKNTSGIKNTRRKPDVQ
jgi:ribosome-associated protein